MWTRSLLLTSEVALSLVLLLGAGLLLRSLAAQQNTELGFAADNRTVFTLSLPAARYPADRVVQTHGPVVGAVRGAPRHRAGGERVGTAAQHLRDDVATLPGPTSRRRRRDSRRSRECQAADPNYFTTMAIPVLAGRAFTPADREGAPRVALISRRMADKFWPGVDPIGRPISINGAPASTIVGIVGDVRSLEVTQAPQPEMYQPLAQTRRARHAVHPQGAGI